MSIYDNLYPWQKALIENIKHKQRYGLFLDMGLGKTIISLALVELHNCDNVIVVTVNTKAIEDETISGSWFSWASKSNMNWKLCRKKETTFDSNSLLLINYEALAKSTRDKNRHRIVLKETVVKFLEHCKNTRTALIVDESHKIKDSSTQQSIAITEIWKCLQRISNETYLYLLTGTPFTNGYIDLYSQLKLLGCPLTKTAFKSAFCELGNIAGLLGYQQPIVGYKNIDALFELVHQYAITIKSDEVMQLPEQIFVNHYTDESEEFRMFTSEKTYEKNIINLANKLSVPYTPKNVKKQTNNPFYRNIAYPSLDWLVDTVGTFWLRCRELSIGFQGNSEYAKWFDRRRLEQIRQFLSTYEDNYVLFYNYTPELLELYDICEELGYKIDVYCSHVKSELYYNEFTRLSDSEKLVNKKRIILANFQSGSTGKNWQEYNKCIIASLPVFRDWQQGLKRIHRTGQKSTTIYHIFSQKNWLDSSMNEALQNRIEYDIKLFQQKFNEFKLTI